MDASTMGVYLTIISLIITVILTVYVHKIGVKQSDFLSANVNLLNEKMNMKKEMERSEEAIKSFANRLETDKDMIRMLLDRIDDKEMKRNVELIVGEIAVEVLKRRSYDMIKLFSREQTTDENS